jgi:hypothetical protein
MSVADNFLQKKQKQRRRWFEKAREGNPTGVTRLSKPVLAVAGRIAVGSADAKESANLWQG